MEKIHYLAKNLSVLLTRITLIFTISFVSFTSLGNAGLNVVIFANDSDLDEYYFKSLTDLIYVNAKPKVKLSQFEIHHFTNEKNVEFKSWDKWKRKVNYKPITKGCDFSLCSSIKSLVLNYGASERHFFINNEFSDCNFSDIYNFSSTRDNVLDATYLKSIIDKHYDKKSKESKTLFILFNNPNENNNLKIEDFPTKIEINKGDPVSLNPLYSDNIELIEWSGYNNLPCLNCEKLEYSPTLSHSLNLKVWDKDKCNSLSQTIEVIVKESKTKNTTNNDKPAHPSNTTYIKSENINNKCLCNSSKFSRIEDVFTTIKHPKYTDDIFKADWKILSRESGGFVFDLITETSCAPKYRLEIFDTQDNIVWKEIYDLDEVNKASRNDLHRLYPDKFIFVLSLYDIENKILNADVFRIKITPVDERNKSCSPYWSPKLIFSKCP